MTEERTEYKGAVVKAESDNAVSLPVGIPDTAITKLENLAIDTIMFNPQVFGVIEKLADIMASGRCTVPAHLMGNKGDCFAVIMQAVQWRMELSDMKRNL